MPRRLHSWLSCGFALVAAGAASAAQETASDARPDAVAPPSIAVARFAHDEETPPVELDVAALLARRLSERLPTDVVEPASFGLQTDDVLEASEVRAWAQRANVDAIVLGRTTSAVGGVAVEVEVRSGHSGVATASYQVPLVAVEDPNPAVDDLAASILTGLGYVPPVASESPAKAAESAEGSAFTLLQKGEPISIQSDELEVTQDGDERHLVFRHAVRVSQGDIALRTDRLDAYYKKGESQPDRFVAKGAVRVEQGERHARCEIATFVNSEQRLTCTGRAALVQGCDLVRGSEIQFDLREERVHVTGGAS